MWLARQNSGKEDKSNITFPSVKLIMSLLLFPFQKWIKILPSRAHISYLVIILSDSFEPKLPFQTFLLLCSLPPVWLPASGPETPEAPKLERFAFFPSSLPHVTFFVVDWDLGLFVPCLLYLWKDHKWLEWPSYNAGSSLQLPFCLFIILNGENFVSHIRL